MSYLIKPHIAAAPAVLVAVATVAAVLSEQVPEVIEARAFRVLDENGTPRAGLGAPGLAFYSEDGTIQTARFGISGLGFFDEQGRQRTALGAYGLTFNDGFKDELEMRARLGVGGLGLYDEHGTPRAGLGASGLVFDDEQGTTRLQLGRVTVVTSRTKAETTYPAALVLFDEEGKVIESLPR